MNANELIKFLNVLRVFVPPYWRGRVDEVITKLGGKVKNNSYDYEQRTFR